MGASQLHGTQVAHDVFVERNSCISCGSDNHFEVAGGSFGDDPLRTFIETDPWGENPMPVLKHHRWSLVECGDCEQRWHRYILSKSWNEIRFSEWMTTEAFAEFAARFDSVHNPVPDVEHVLRLRDMGVKRLLDFGCGEGRFIEMCHLFGIEAHGVDRSNARRSAAGVQVHAELEDVPGTFDAITMFEVLEHLDDPLAILKALRSRLNPGGVMVMEVPDTSGVNGISDRDSYFKIHPLDHINAFTPESLVAIMGEVGLKPLAKAPVFVTTSLKRVAKDVAKAKLKQNSTQRYFTASS